MKDREFFNSNEANDLKKLNDFNNAINLFTSITPAKEKHYCDASGKTSDRIFNIELKNRNQIITSNGKISGCSQNGKVYIDETIFVEDHKLSDMILDYITEGIEPLYINFLSNGWVIIFNLSKLTLRPKKYLNMKINSKGYQSMEFGNRQGLYLKDAAIYDNNYKLIKKAGEEWKEMN